MPRMTQLEQDLLNNAHTRLNTWIKDTVMRCDVADLSEQSAASIIMSCLLNKYTEACVDLGMSLSDYLIICQQAHAHVTRQQKRREDEKSA